MLHGPNGIVTRPAQQASDLARVMAMIDRQSQGLAPDLGGLRLVANGALATLLFVLLVVPSEVDAVIAF